jgi:hypothetical protein
MNGRGQQALPLTICVASPIFRRYTDSKRQPSIMGIQEARLQQQWRPKRGEESS